MIVGLNGKERCVYAVFISLYIYKFNILIIQGIMFSKNIYSVSKARNGITK